MISFGNTIKKVSAIRRAHELGVTMFALNSREELEKLARYAPGERVYCRILVENEGADWPLSRKFGTTVESARDLMLEAADLGLDPYGLSFHVGSQQTTTRAYELAIGKVAMLFTDLTEAGINLRMMNLGGGFPTRYRDDVPEIDQFSYAIMRAMTEHFGNNLPEMVIEPGRFIVGDAGLVQAEVVLVSRRNRNDPVRWVYLDIGRFGGLAETEGESIKYRITTPHDGRKWVRSRSPAPPATVRTSCTKVQLPPAVGADLGRPGGTAVNGRLRDDLRQHKVQRLRPAGGVLSVGRPHAFKTTPTSPGRPDDLPVARPLPSRWKISAYSTA